MDFFVHFVHYRFNKTDPKNQLHSSQPKGNKFARTISNSKPWQYYNYTVVYYSWVSFLEEQFNS